MYIFLFALLLSTFTARTPFCNVESLQEMEHYRNSIRDIHVLQRHEAHKNSFVLSPERHVGHWTHKGFRYTVLDVSGSGSVQHIWTTRGSGEPYHIWEIYIDGEETPSISGTDEEIIAAAEAYSLPVAPANHVPLANRDFNLFLPIPFSTSCRIDLVQRVPSFWLWFCQIDYRLDDRSMNGTRLVGHRDEDDTLSFHYLGLSKQMRTSSSSNLPIISDTVETLEILPGETLRVLSLDGPAIVRELRLRWSEDADLRVLVRYEEEDTFAVNALADRFFGPFKGVSFYQHTRNDSSCYLPMPFRKTYEVLLKNEDVIPVTVSGHVHAEPVPIFDHNWGYFHALQQQTEATNGHRPHQVLYARGRGHWLGMTLYETGHDHGGGDFAVVDGESESPSFLHGINGEDYFTFAWFGKGAHHPYAVAHENHEGRYRHHFENVYPFEHSIAVEWGAFADHSPTSVAVWYQESPVPDVLPDGAREESVSWDVFGPVPIPHDEQGNWTVEPFSILPAVADLDAGMTFECRGVEQSFESGWNQEWSVGPMLNLTYIARHGMAVDPESELGGIGHAMLARRFLSSNRDETKTFIFSHDDPVELWVNQQCVFKGSGGFNGFITHRVDVPLREGKNEIVVRLSNRFNRNFNWAGFLMRPIAP